MVSYVLLSCLESFETLSGHLHIAAMYEVNPAVLCQELSHSWIVLCRMLVGCQTGRQTGRRREDRVGPQIGKGLVILERV